MQFPMRFFKSTRSMLASIGAILVLAACQSTESVSENVKDVEFTFLVDRAALHPDSASWSVATKSGNANLGHDSSTVNDTFRVAIHLPNAIGDDTLYVSLWRNHMLTSRQAMLVKSAGEIEALGKGRDTLATIILDRMASLNDSFPGAFPLNQDSSVAKSLAVLLVQGHPMFANWRTKVPAGVDTARVRVEALEYAASLGKPLTVIVASWNLDLPFDEARVAILSLVPVSIPASDTDALFPTPPVQVAVPVSISASLYSDSTPVSVGGKFIAKKRLYPPVFLVNQAGVAIADHFEIVWLKSPTGSVTSWDLAAEGGVTIRAYGNVPPGSYELVVSMDDGSFADTSKVVFQVLPKPDRQGPTVVRIAPLADMNLPFADSVFQFRIQANDSAGVASVTLNGKPMSKTGDEYSLVDTIRTKGVISEYVVKATDNHGNGSETVVRLLREGSSSAKPTATPIQPASRTGDTIPETQAVRHIEWKITDPVGISPTTVMINLLPATKINDSTWGANIAIPPTGKATTVLVQALNTNGNGVVDSVRIVRRADKTAPNLKVVVGSRAVFFDTTSAKIVWKVSDNLKLDSVWINGVPQTLRADSTYTANIALATGFNTARIRARDSSGNFSVDSQKIQRLANNTPPVLVALPGTVDQVVAYTGSDSILVRWRATGNDRIDSVLINGAKASSSKDTFWLKLPLGPGKNPIVVQAWNSSTKPATDSISVRTALKDAQGNLYRIAKMPDGRVWMGQNLYTTPNYSCAKSSCPEYGAFYGWKQAFPLTDSTSTAPRGVCPTGWHIPTRTEWSNLFKSVIPKASSDSTLFLRSSTGWYKTNCTTVDGVNTCTTDSTNGTNQYENFLVANSSYSAGGSGGSTSYSYSDIWLPGGASTNVGNKLHLEQKLVTERNVTKYSTGSTGVGGVRCIQNQLRIIIDPIDIKTPILIDDIKTPILVK
ncbi:MAG: hypothetical protein RL173_639 [Fibrobacterota bacterium]|jgi:uncharacterized protein (TIGR02145 family)